MRLKKRAALCKFWGTMNCLR